MRFVPFTSLLIYLFGATIALSGCGLDASISKMVGLQSDGSTNPTPTPTPPPGGGNLDVSINQSVTQPDPTATLPVRFVITFSEAIDPSSFDLNDLTITGSASGVNWVLTNIGDNKTYYLDANSFVSAGTVNILLDANKVLSANGGYNNAAQIIDNEVTFVTSNAPYVLKNINVADAWSNPTEFFKIGNYIVFSANGFRSYNTVTKQFENVDTTKPTPTQYTKLGELAGFIYYRGNTASFGEELWKTDGTNSGTVQVKDIISGTDSGNPSFLHNPGFGGVIDNVLNGYLYFAVGDASSSIGRQLWRTNGTDAGTTMVADLEPGAGSSEYYYIVGVAQNKMFFISNTATDGYELYTTTGTPASVQIIDMRPGVSNGASSSYDAMVFNDSVLFSCWISGSGYELCKTDGNVGTTTIVKDIYTGVSGSFPVFKEFVNGILYFTARNTTHGTELWATDGTSANTVELLDANSSGDGYYRFYDLTLANSNKFYFQAETPGQGMRIWSSDGTTAGTQLLTDLHPSTSSSETMSYIYTVIRLVHNNLFYFVATTVGEGTEYWVTDGTPGGTHILKDINPGVGDGYSYVGPTPNHIVSLGSKIYFAAKDSNGIELWESQGSSVSTVMTKDIYTGSNNSSYPSNFFSDGTQMYFGATSVMIGEEPWVSDGTSAGTTLLQNLQTDNGSSNPRQIQALGTKIFFIGDSTEYGTELMSSDGTIENTANISNQSLIDIVAGNASSYISHLTVWGGQILFIANNLINYNSTLWKSDGTASGTQIINSDVGNSGSFDGWVSNIVKANNFVYFIANNSTLNIRLWKSDGTFAGTSIVHPTMYFDYDMYAATLGDTLLFNNWWDWEPGVSDGSNATLFNLNPTGDSYPSDFIATNNNIYFVADGVGTNDYELYKSSGALPVLVSDINASGSSSPRPFLSDGNILYFIATDGIGGDFLYKTDGTTTTQIKEVNSTHSLWTTANGIKMGSHIYFSVDDGVNGVELWKSDGTFAGTALLKDICSPACDSSPDNFFVDGAKLYFSADNGVNGVELWSSDGTANGTVMIDLNPGAASSYPSDFVKLGTKIYFSAIDVNYGKELWVIPNP